VSESFTAGGASTFDPEAFARQTVDAVEFGDHCAEDLERRVIRLEEIIAARWPRSMFLQRRLARELRVGRRVRRPPAG
jgi:hypothetical protein